MGAHLGEVCAIAAALFWAGAVCFFKKSGETMPPLALNLLRNLVAVVLVSLSLLATDNPWPPECSAGDCLLLALSGIMVMAVADTMFLAALNRIGMGMWAIVSCFYSPTVILMAYFTLGETLGVLDLIGAAIIMMAIAFTTAKTEGVTALQKSRVTGVALGIASLVITALGVIVMKPPLVKMPLMWAMEIRLGGATVGLLLFALVARNRRAIIGALKPSSAWKYVLPGAALGGFVAVGFWMAGFKYGAVGGVAVLAQINILFIALFARVFLKETLTLKKAIRLGAAMAGALMVAVF